MIGKLVWPIHSYPEADGDPKIGCYPSIPVPPNHANGKLRFEGHFKVPRRRRVLKIHFEVPRKIRGFE
jgi:hypothetical protein